MASGSFNAYEICMMKRWNRVLRGLLALGVLWWPSGMAAEPESRVAEEWPHFLGPHLNATTRESPLMKEWPKDGLEILWEEETGDG